jgi:hypothetical protein
MRCRRATFAEVCSHFAVLMCLAAALMPARNSHATTQLIALTGDVQPGSLAQLSGVSQATLNNAGDVAFRATLAHGIDGVSASNDRAVWKIAGGQRSLLTWGGVDLAPWGGTVDLLPSVSIDDAGDVVVRGTSAIAQGIWRYPQGGAGQVIAATGVTGVPGAVGNMLGAIGAPHLHHAGGAVVYNGTLADDATVTPENDRGVWLDDGAGAMLAREHVTAPPGVPGGVFSIPIATAVGATGEAALIGSLKPGFGGVVSDTSLGLWRIGPNGGNLVARRSSGGVHGLVGASFAAFQDPTINDGGAVAFNAQLAAGGSITATNDRGIWLVDTATGHLLAQTGSSAPGVPGSAFAQFGDPLLNNANEALVEGALVAGVGGVNSTNAEGLWRLTPDGGTLVARTGSAGVPGAPAASFADFGSLAFSSAGTAAVYATLSAGAGGVTTSNDEGVWLFTSAGAHLVAREGDSLAGRIIEDLEFTGGSGGSDGRQRSLNDSSQLLFKATFTNGDEGLFLFTPEGGSTNIADFTLDGRVDGLDLARLRSRFGAASGASARSGDADGDADVDGADFLAWQREVGFGVSAAAVPEPSAPALLFPTSVLLILVVRRDRVGIPRRQRRIVHLPALQPQRGDS